MTALRFTVPGRPRPKQRARTGKGGHHYTPAKTAAYERSVATCAQHAAGIRWRQLSGPLQVEVVAVYPRPKSRPEGLCREAWAAGERLWRPSVPDIDNCCKAVLDGLNRSGVYEDDRQIVRLEASKFYAAKGETAHVEVTIRPASETTP